MKNNRFKKNILSMIDGSDKKSLFYKYIFILKGQEKNKKTKNTYTYIIGFIFRIIFLICLLTFSYKISFSKNTVKLYTNMLEISKELAVNIFGIIFTGYGLFQAFMNKNTLKRLIENSNCDYVIKNKSEDDKNNSMPISIFEELNIYFGFNTLLNLFLILLNYIISNLILIIPENYIIFKNIKISNVVACTFIFIYITLHIILLISIKSLIVNIYNIFITSALGEVIDGD